MSPNRLLAVLTLSLITAASAWAQGGATGAISGTVQDPSGAAVSGAKIDIISEATGQSVRQATADSAGLFSVPLLPVGSYTVEVTASGFATTKFPGVIVRITETTRMTAAMKPATIREVIEVQSQVAQVDTNDATTGQSVGSQTITSLPLATRNFQQLLDLNAGATANLNNAAALGRGDVRVDVNGGREDNNNYLIEGVSASDYSFGELTYTPVPNPDDVQEFKVSTSLYDATQGRNGGGNINAILKGGTSNFHGDLWEYFRNSKLDAGDYFLGPFVLKQNIFGGDFGGPVGPKAKLGYFYVNYQGTRQRSGDSLGTYINTSIPVLPTLNRGVPGSGPGTYQQTLLDTFFCGAACAGASLPINPVTNQPQLDPVALALLNVQGTQFGSSPGGFLVPTVPGTPGFTNGVLNYGPLVLSVPGRYRDDQFTANWDRDFNNTKDRISERFFWSDSETYEPFGADNLQVQTGYPAYATNLNFPLDVPLRGRFGSVAETHTFTNALINEFRFGVNIISDSLLNVHLPGTSPSELGIYNQYGQPSMYRFQFLSWQLGPFPNEPQKALSDSLVYLDTVSWTKGRHTLRFGGEIDRTSDRRVLPVLDTGLLYLTGGNPGDANITDFQNFLMGYTGLGEAGSGAPNHDYHIPAFGAFVQDDYRATQALTLNLGYRTEWVGAASDSLCHLGNAVLENANTIGNPFVYPKCVSQYGYQGFTGTLNEAALNNEYSTVIEPRIGFAYDIGGEHKTVVRGGYGIYSVREDIGAVDNLSFTAPFYPLGGGGSTPVGDASFGLTAPGMGLGCLFNSSATAGTSCTGAGPFPLPNLGQVSPCFVPQTSVFQGFTGGNTSALPIFGVSAATNAACPAPTIGTLLPAADFFGLAVPLHWIVPTTQQWNLTVQRQLGANWVLELGYVGTKGTHLRSTFDPDQPSLAGPAGSGFSPINLTCASSCVSGAPGTVYSIITNTNVSTGNAQARAPYFGVNPSLLEAFYPNSDSHYSALQATISHRFSKGLYFQGAYTWSKSIDDVSTASVAFVTRVNNQLDGNASRGLSDFHHPQRFVASLNYALPFLAGRHDAMGYALGGWEVATVVVAESGSPITIADGNGASAYGPPSPPEATADFASGFSCANALNSGGLATKIANWVNPAAYTPVGPVPFSPDGSTGFGDSPRNCILGPKQFNTDFTVGKVFKLGERQNLRFRAEFFNLFNHPSFQNPQFTGNADVEAGVCPGPSSTCHVGQITATNGTPRLIQFSLKYLF